MRSLRQMLKGFMHARLACGCRITFREGVEGSPVLVVVADKSPQCASTLHVAGLPVFDTRESLLTRVQRPGSNGSSQVAP